jgi:hypothetical protein
VDIRPEVVIHMGDSADLPSLSGYDKGKRSFIGKTYRQDIEAHLDFQRRMWEPVFNRKKKLPYSVFLIGNHEQRIERALDQSPELVGSIGFQDLELEKYYNTIVPYEGSSPGTIEIDGVTYAHYFTSGVLGRAVNTEHTAYTLIAKNLSSCTTGHTHTLEYCVRTKASGEKVHGLSCGCFQDYTNDWAGEIGKLWDRGVIVKRNVKAGNYDLEWICLETIIKEYSP